MTLSMEITHDERRLGARAAAKRGLAAARAADERRIELEQQIAQLRSRRDELSRQESAELRDQSSAKKLATLQNEIAALDRQIALVEADRIQAAMNCCESQYIGTLARTASPALTAAHRVAKSRLKYAELRLAAALAAPASPYKTFEVDAARQERDAAHFEVESTYQQMLAE